MVPSSPYVPCSTGKKTTGPSCACGFTASERGTGAGYAGSPRRPTGRPPAAVTPSVRARSGSATWSQRPSFVMPTGITSYLFRSRACSTFRADISDTSCSPERPPKSR